VIRKLGVLAVVALAGTWIGFKVLGGGASYHVKVVLGSATNLVVGGTVDVNGFKAGKISRLSVRDGKALVELSLNSSYAPLHDGSKVVVDWKALLGERVVYITDGSRSNAKIPSGGMIAGSQAEPVELDRVLTALDAKTRGHLVSLVKSLNSTIGGKTNEQNLSATLQSAGPALQALGGVLRALGTDGPAIKNLVSQLNSMVTTVSSRDANIQVMIDDLAHLTTLTAAQRQSLTDALKRLPATLQVANKALGDVPGAVANSVPLLKDLRPATAQLPGAAHNLKPVLVSLQPVATRLRSSLSAVAQLLQYTPGLLSAANTTLPGIESTLTYLQPVLSFLRPYTPEAAGFFATWGSAFANYDANGHYARAFAQASGTSLNVNPGVQPPGTTNAPYPLPGATGGQPWTDAAGSGPR
jgi:phospholipid/cholesterol/gamma-HCH transport system substrate-binding protein